MVEVVLVVLVVAAVLCLVEVVEGRFLFRVAEPVTASWSVTSSVSLELVPLCFAVLRRLGAGLMLRRRLERVDELLVVRMLLLLLLLRLVVVVLSSLLLG